ncbi:Photosystem I reaction center subunit XI, chloroplastic [Ananas comosus]|uniref:Photosystem I reaction center subunit XI, chloroplastic n=1 Tax=Ananas comosus TaxID=4615 RepID=A0A199UVN8_ANACO|nr:Photosystem I reaction center subunit XI, chloroplastic [Ananas comosus]
MASQLRSSFLSPTTTTTTTSSRVLVTPRGISGNPLRDLHSRRRSSLTVRAVVPEKDADGADPGLRQSRSIYIPGVELVSPLLRGVEVGLAHGYLLVGPFVITGPLRNTPYAGQAGSLAAAGLVVILSICLTMYGIASFKEGDPSVAPSLTLTGRKKEADKLQTAEGWAQFSGGFFFGGISGVIWAYFLLYVLDLPYYIK